MTRFAIDAPTLLRVVRASSPVHPARTVHPDHTLVAPNSIRSQALELLLPDVRAGELTDAAALQLHDRMTELKLRLLGDRVSRSRAWRLARAHGWSTLRDAEYLAIAALQADALVTVDDDLAAKARGIVPLARLDDLFES